MICGRCYATRADVVAHLVLFVLWLMLLPLIVADVIATYYNYIEYG